jgi:chemotaxis protein CheD
MATLALGSCVGVVILAPRLQLAGLVHVVLPDSGVNRRMGVEKPGYFADTGIPLLIKKMIGLGCNFSDLVIKIAGGASIMGDRGVFNISGRNVKAVKKHLKHFKLAPAAEDVGDGLSRRLTVFPDTGQVLVESPGNGEWVL